MSKNLKCLECGGNYHECKCSTRIMNLYLRKSEVEQENAELKEELVKAKEAFLAEQHACVDALSKLDDAENKIRELNNEIKLIVRFIAQLEMRVIHYDGGEEWLENGFNHDEHSSPLEAFEAYKEAQK